MKPTSQKQKVLYLITKSNWGGAQRYVYDLATNLDRDRFEPVVALGGDGSLAEQLTHAHVRVIRIESLGRDISLQKEWAFTKELWSVLRAERPDVFHVNSSKAGGVGTVLGRLARVPRVLFTAHGWAFNEDRPWWQKPLIKFLHWLTVVFSHKTIAVSHAIPRQLNWPLARNKYKVINPGRNIGAMFTKTDARRFIAAECPDLEPQKRTTWIMTIAELHPIKRFPVLLEAAARLRHDHPTARFILIGDGQQRAELERQIKHERLEGTVFLTGSIHEAARFLKAADLFVLPSKSESYGYVLHEAGLAELPVIATNVGGIPDIVSHDRTGRLVPPDDVEALTAEIGSYLAHPGGFDQMRHSLHNLMRERTVERMAAATTALYSLPLQ